MTLENDGAAAPVETTPVSGSETISSPAPEPAVAPEAEAKADEPYTDEAFTSDLSNIWDKHNPARNADGKFVSTKPAEAGEQVSDQSPTDKPAEPESVIGMPQSWSADRKAAWDQLPPAAKDIVLQREQEVQRTLSDQGRKIKASESLRSVVEQYQDTFERHGVTPEVGIARLIEAERMLDDDPVRALGELARMYRVDLRKVAGLQPSGNVPPDVAALLERNARMESQLQELRNRVEGREKAEADTQFKTIEKQIAEFAKDKADWTDLEKETYGQILALKAEIASGDRDDMSHLDLLKEAYGRAQVVNPVAWAKRMALEKADENARKIEEAKKRTADARKSQSLNVKSSAANSSTPKTMEETLQAIADRAYGGR
jgi:hypothetical protein